MKYFISIIIFAGLIVGSYFLIELNFGGQLEDTLYIVAAVVGSVGNVITWAVIRTRAKNLERQKADPYVYKNPWEDRL